MKGCGAAGSMGNNTMFSHLLCQEIEVHGCCSSTASQLIPALSVNVSPQQLGMSEPLQSE